MSRAEIGHGLGCITFVITTRTLGPVSIIMPNIIDRENWNLNNSIIRPAVRNSEAGDTPWKPSFQDTSPPGAERANGQTQRTRLGEIL